MLREGIKVRRKGFWRAFHLPKHVHLDSETGILSGNMPHFGTYEFSVYSFMTCGKCYEKFDVTLQSHPNTVKSIETLLKLAMKNAIGNHAMRSGVHYHEYEEAYANWANILEFMKRIDGTKLEGSLREIISEPMKGHSISSKKKTKIEIIFDLIRRANTLKKFLFDSIERYKATGRLDRNRGTSELKRVIMELQAEMLSDEDIQILSSTWTENSEILSALICFVENSSPDVHSKDYQINQSFRIEEEEKLEQKSNDSFEDKDKEEIVWVDDQFLHNWSKNVQEMQEIVLRLDLYLEYNHFHRLSRTQDQDCKAQMKPNRLINKHHFAHSIQKSD